MEMRTMIRIITTLLCITTATYSQETIATKQQERVLEEMAERDESVIDDDALLQQLENYIRHPLNLNVASADDLRQLQILTEIQVNSFIRHRELFGSLIHIYELQAIPYWDLPIIHRLLPFICVKDNKAALDRDDLRRGNNSFLIRFSPGKLQQEVPDAEKFLGSPHRLMIRYRYQAGNKLQGGFLMDKDAGEPLFKSPLKTGFDFNSFHVFYRSAGMVQQLALGDFTVNWGQGLIQWQAMSFRKGGDLVNGKRQSAVLRPYTSAGEYNFYRGAGITLRKRSVILTMFASFRKLTANLDESNGTRVITSLLPFGLHRTASEIKNRNVVSLKSAGLSIGYERKSGHVGLNGVYHHYSQSILKNDEPYNLFSLAGKGLGNLSFNYDYTWQNIHAFGEVAYSINDSRLSYNKRLSPGDTLVVAISNEGRSRITMVTPNATRLPLGLINGLLISLHQSLSAGFLFRHLSPVYHSQFSSAFTESSTPSNETGLFFGLNFKPGRTLTIDAFIDLFRFPWLRYRVPEPSQGQELMLGLTYRPSRKVEVNSRVRLESTVAATSIHKWNWRSHVTWQVQPNLRLRQRIELTGYSDRNGDSGVQSASQPAQQGYLVYYDVNFKPPQWGISLAARFQFFETDGFNARIYSFENHLYSAVSIPAIYHKGVRYYFTGQCKLNRQTHPWYPGWLVPLHLSFRWAQTSYQMQAGKGFPTKTAPDFGIQFIFSNY